VGIEFLGRPWSEAKLLGFAYAFEQATKARRPPASTPSLAR
jgi:Asp-tRNA(Asn)/Glu-tRNA(Gln) amidotransferase A subunit family amidase